MKTINEFNFAGTVWRILLAQDAPLLLIETRNAETRTAVFYVLDLKNLEFLISDLELTEKWWVGMESIKNNCIYFHFYDGSQYANHKGILCYDINTKNTKWTTDKLAFVGWNKNTLITSENGILKQIDCFSGEIIAKNVDYKLENQSESDIILLDTDMENFGKVSAFITKFTQRVAVKHIEYLEYKSNIFISYYICDNDKFDNYFMHVDAESGSILMDIVLEAQSKGVGSESFAVYYDYLILCKNKQNLSFYAL